MKENINSIKKRAFFCNFSIEGTLSGIEYSSFKRAWLFERLLNVSSFFITTKLSVNGYIFWEKLKERGLVPESSQHINVYDSYMMTSKGESYPVASLSAFDTLNVNPVSKESDRVVLSDNLSADITWRNSSKKKIYTITYYSQGKVVRRDFFGKHGQLSIKRTYSFNGKVLQDDIYQVTGKRVLTINYCQSFKVVNVLKYYPDGIRLKYIFKSEHELILHWLKRQDFLVSDVFLIDKNRVWGPALSEYRKSKNITLISTLHSSHLRDSYKSPVRNNLNSNYSKILLNQWMLDALVVLTDEQRDDIVNNFSVNSRIFTIPHAKDFTMPIKKYHQRDNNMLVTIGRLSSEKQFEQAILIMEQVVKKFPKKKLYIYGEGREREKLEKLVKSKKLERNIFLPGHTTDISKVLDSATLYLCTSKVEGFPLTLLESLSHGVPIVSYNIKYGPSSMIVDNENGFLVEKDNIEAAANKVIDFYSTPGLPELMSKNAYKLSELFSQENLAKKWENILGSYL